AALPAAFAVAFAIAASPGSSIPAEAAQIKSSAVCKTLTTVCQIFGQAGTIPLIAGMIFDAPAAGTALVSFNGTMQCANNNFADDVNHGVVDVTTQIVTDAAAVPNAQAPGGQRFDMHIPATATNHWLAVNLASSLVTHLTAGT